MQFFLKILSGLANSVDPDQTAPEGAICSGSTVFGYAVLSETVLYKILGDLLYFIFSGSLVSFNSFKEF